uniref:Integral membrane protein 2 n=1 Tax=Rhinolophus ferrumequinum TaxID=59479 RepID=A0A671F4P5_RHIFE
MVKISFQPAVAGIKGDKADKASAAAPAPGPAAEILLTPAREERPPYHRYKKGGSVGGVCYLSMGMVVLLMGLVFASVYIYRYFFLAQLARDNFFHCGVFYEDSLSSQVRTRMELEEDVKIYLEDNYERINVPVPQFGGGDPADIIHDFQRLLSGTSYRHRRGKEQNEGGPAQVFRNRGCTSVAGSDSLPRHLPGQVLRHRAQHHHRAAPSKFLGAPHEREEGDLPPTDVHHPGGDGSHRACQRQGGPGLLHLPPVQREGHLPAETQGDSEANQQAWGQELQCHPPLREHLRGRDADLRGGVKASLRPTPPLPSSSFSFQLLCGPPPSLT